MSIGPVLLLFICSLGITSVSVCQYIFYKEKSSPFIYKYITKSILQLLVENPPSAAAGWYIYQRVAGPFAASGAGALVWATHSVVTNYHQQIILADMYKVAAHANASVGVPAPAPVEFTPAGVKYAIAHKAGTTVVQMIQK